MTQCLLWISYMLNVLRGFKLLAVSVVVDFKFVFINFMGGKAPPRTYRILTFRHAAKLCQAYKYECAKWTFLVWIWFGFHIFWTGFKLKEYFQFDFKIFWQHFLTKNFWQFSNSPKFREEASAPASCVMAPVFAMPTQSPMHTVLLLHSKTSTNQAGVVYRSQLKTNLFGLWEHRA